MSKHTPEPWEIKRQPNEGWGDNYLVVGANHTGGTEGVIFHEFDYGQELTEWERIVACVNHCKGATNEELEAVSHDQLKAERDELKEEVLFHRAHDMTAKWEQLDKLRKQRDELLAALSRIYQTSNHDGSHFQLAKELLEKHGYDLITGKPHETPPQP